MADYVVLPLEQEPPDIEDDVYTYIQNIFPDWEPREGHLEVIHTEAMAQIIAELLRLATDVPPAIFRYFGKLADIQPIEAEPARATTTWTMIDTLGHTIPAGTLVGITAGGDEIFPFETVEEIVIAPGSNATAAGAVVIQALESGADASALTNSPVLIDVLDYVSSVTLVGATFGGVDAETDDEYLARLSGTLQLMANRVILARDVENYCRTLAGISRALARDNYVAGINEIQQIAITGGVPVSGKVNLVWNGQTSADVQWNTTAAALQTALENLSNIEVGDVVAAGGPWPATPITVTFKRALGYQNVAAITITTPTLSAGAATVTTPTAGVASVTVGTASEKTVAVGVMDSAGAAISPALKTALQAMLALAREANFIFTVHDPDYTTIAVTTTVKAHTGFDLVDLKSRVETAVLSFLAPATWGAPQFGEVLLWVDTPFVRGSEMIEVINSVEGVNYIESLVINGVTFVTASAVVTAANITLYGMFPVPSSASTAVATVTGP